MLVPPVLPPAGSAWWRPSLQSSSPPRNNTSSPILRGKSRERKMNTLGNLAETREHLGRLHSKGACGPLNLSFTTCLQVIWFFFWIFLGRKQNQRDLLGCFPLPSIAAQSHEPLNSRSGWSPNTCPVPKALELCKRKSISQEMISERP